MGVGPKHKAKLRAADLLRSPERLVPWTALKLSTSSCRAHCRSSWMTCLRPSSAQHTVALPCLWPSSTCLTSWTSRPTSTRSTTLMCATPGRAIGAAAGGQAPPGWDCQGKAECGQAPPGWDCQGKAEWARPYGARISLGLPSFQPWILSHCYSGLSSSIELLG